MFRFCYEIYGMVRVKRKKGKKSVNSDQIVQIVEVCFLSKCGLFPDADKSLMCSHDLFRASRNTDAT